MTQLRRDAAYIQTESRRKSNNAVTLTAFDEEVCGVLKSAHTVASAAKTLAASNLPAADKAADLEARVAASMLRLLQAERIELSPDS